MGIRKSRWTSTGRKERYGRAVRLFQSRAYDQAAAAFEDIAGNDDLCGMLSTYFAGECYLQLGLEQLQKDAFQLAANLFMRASRLNPRHLQLPQYLACCFARLGKYDRAACYSERETALAADERDARIRLALSLWQDGQQLSAIRTLQEGVLARPQQVEWQFQLGVLLAAREEFEQARKALEKVLAQAPEHAEALFQLALCDGARDRPDRALSSLIKAQQLRPHDARICLYLALASQAAGAGHTMTPATPRVPLAPAALEVADVEELTTLIAEEPDVAEAFTALPHGQREDNVLALLAAVLDRAVLRHPRRAELHYHQGQIYNRLGKTDQAIASCERAVEIKPQLVQALVTLAKLYNQTDRRKDAQARFQQVLDMGYEYADVYFELGCIYREEGELQRARASYHRALQINRNYSAARTALQTLAA